LRAAHPCSPAIALTSRDSFQLSASLDSAHRGLRRADLHLVPRLISLKLAAGKDKTVMWVFGHPSSGKTFFGDYLESRGVAHVDGDLHAF